MKGLITNDVMECMKYNIKLITIIYVILHMNTEHHWHWSAAVLH